MPADENKATMREAIGHFNEGDLDAYLKIYDEESLALHGYPPQLPPDFEGVKQFYGMMFAAFPDAKVDLEGVVAEGDEVACRYTFRATHRGEFMGVPPSGNRVTMAGMTILRFANGKCVERWQNADMLGLMQQLGAIPAPEGAEA